MQLLEHFGGINAENIKRMSEIVKDCNSLILYYFLKLVLYVYSIIKIILYNYLKKYNLNYKKSEIKVAEGEILQLNPNSIIFRNTFEIKENYHSFLNPYIFSIYEFESEEMLLEYCKLFGVSEEDVELLLEYGCDADSIEEMLMGYSNFGRSSV